MSNSTIPRRGNVLNQIASRLRSAGYEKKFLQRIIPEWWTAEAESSPSALAQLKVILAQRLGLDVELLLSSNVPVPKMPPGMQFKRALRQSPSEAGLAYFAAAGKLLASITPDESPIGATAATIRDSILAGSREPFVSLKSLLEYAWSHGIAVVHIADTPVSKKGLAAIVGRFSDRFVIMLTRQTQRDAWLAFHVAHELGHIALGHVSQTEAVIDDETPIPDVVPSFEEAADKFALDLLGGTDLVDFWSRYADSAQALAEAVAKRAPAYKVDPEHVILRYGREHGFPFASRALQYIERRDNRSPRDIVNDIALDHLKAADVSDEGQEMVSDILMAA